MALQQTYLNSLLHTEASHHTNKATLETPPPSITQDQVTRYVYHPQLKTEKNSHKHLLNQTVIRRDYFFQKNETRSFKKTLDREKKRANNWQHRKN